MPEDSPIKRDPRDHSWGYYSHDDLPGMGPTGAFRWFDTLEDSADHIQWVIDQYVDSERAGVQKKAAAHGVLSKVRTGDLTPNDALPLLNGELENLVQVPWWGRFDELAGGDQSFVKNVRQKIRVYAWDQDWDEADGSPILPEREDDFVAAVQEYGY